MMKLSCLLESLPQKQLVLPPGKGPESMDPKIGSIHYRAADVKPGGLFVAVRGFKADGHDFIGEAVSRGAVAIICERKVLSPVIQVEVGNSRKAMAIIADRFFNEPTKKLVVIAVTGTNGKTTTASLVENILIKAGCKTGLISTVYYRYGESSFDNPMTTPESMDLQAILACMLDHGVTHVVMEASSHAIELFRVQNCRLDVAVFTNLTQDHLDLHGDMASYWETKKRLFTDFLPAGFKKDHALAVVNCNNEHGRELFALLCRRADLLPPLGVGNQVGQLRALQADIRLDGISGVIETPLGKIDFRSPLAGKYNLENILCAVGAATALNLPLQAIQTGISEFTAVPGRLEAVPNNRGKFVFVDYAHTPDALENVLTNLRAIARGRIICIFGCGGDRDKTKRPLMGKIAATHADLVVVTSDNPRSEDPKEIIADILKGIQPLGIHFYGREMLTDSFGGKGVLVEVDRRAAIRLGIQLAAPGDTVVIAGKGHEKYQLIGSQKLPFDDRAEAMQMLGA